MGLVFCLTGSLALSCATAQAPGLGEVVVSQETRELWRGPTTYTVRGLPSGAHENAVRIPGVGEILVNDGVCRLVRSSAGVDRVEVFVSQGNAQGDGCATPDPAHDAALCFRHARFVGSRESSTGVIVVNGCASENDLVWGKLQGASSATVGPTLWRRRCARIVAEGMCEIIYLRKRSLEVAKSVSTLDDFTFNWVGDGWQACFLEREAGPYAMSVLVEDTCGKSANIRIAGDSADLDD